MDLDLRRLVDLDGRLVQAARSIKVLTHLNWPVEAGTRFLHEWRTGRPSLPVVEIPRPDFADQVRELESIAAACDRSHPVGDYVARTALSYLTAARMLESTGTPAFTELSERLYGKPGDDFGVPGLTNLDASDQFIRAAQELLPHLRRTDDEVCLTPEAVAESLRRDTQDLFGNRPFEITVDANLAARAAAGAHRLRLRGSTCFHAADVPQLLQHEAYVHSATMRNGREQPSLKSLGLGAPRTTGTQEGLATFAELITTTMDLSRMQRIGLRVEAIRRALDGADFVDVFRFFLEAGQNENDSYQSARRVFRGGDVRGRIAFTRDAVYVQGLVLTHVFLRKAIQAGKVSWPGHLFAGRLTWGDVLRLEPFLESGFIAPAVHRPDWVARTGSLAAYLTYAVFADRLPLGLVRLEDFRNDGKE